MTQMIVDGNERNTGNQEGTHRTHPVHTYLARILERLSCMELPEKDHVENYLRYKVRSHHKTRTMNSSFGSIIHFLSFYGRSGKREIKEVERTDLEAFIEHEQDRGMHISTVKTRLGCIVAFLHYLIEQDLIPNTAVRKRIRVKLPETLPPGHEPSGRCYCYPAVQRISQKISDLFESKLRKWGCQKMIL